MNYYCQTRQDSSRHNSLSQRRHSRPFSKRQWRWKVSLWAGLVGLLVGIPWFIQRGTIQGVPVSILVKFLADQPSREAYFSGQKVALHERLNHLGVEEDIKAFYRPSIPDEVELDRFIHQLMYDRTGYVGASYKLDLNGQLRLITPVERQFPQWFSLALRAGLVTASFEEDGVWWVKTSQGEYAPYLHMAARFPLQLLNQYFRCIQRLTQLRRKLGRFDIPELPCEQLLTRQ